MYKLQCKKCKNIIEIDKEVWDKFERSLNVLPKPFNSSGLVILDNLSKCCNNPNYWEVKKINED